MRRTAHFRIMVTSLILLLLKGARSDYTETNQNLNFTETGLTYPCNRFIPNGFHLNTSVLRMGYVNNSTHGKSKWLTFGNSTQIKSVKSYAMVIDFKDIETPMSRREQVHRERGDSSTQQKIVRSRSLDKYEGAAERERRRNIQIPADRKVVSRRQTDYNRRYGKSKNEINIRREMRASNSRLEGRRRLDLTRMQSITGRIDIHTRRAGQSKKSRRENNNRSNRHKQSQRIDVVNQHYDIRRSNERNSLSSEKRNLREKSDHVRRMRSYERGHGYINRNDIRKRGVQRNCNTREERRDAVRNSNIRKVQRENIYEVKKTHTRQNSNIRQERRENGYESQCTSAARRNTNIREEQRKNRYEVQYTRARRSSNIGQERRENINEVQNAQVMPSSNIGQERREKRGEVHTISNSNNRQEPRENRHAGQTRRHIRSSNIRQERGENRVTKSSERVVEGKYHKMHITARQGSNRGLHFKVQLGRRRVEDLKVTLKRENYAILRSDVQPAFNRVESEFRRLEEERQGDKNRRNRQLQRSEDNKGNRRSRMLDKYGSDDRQLRRVSVPGMKYKTASFENIWNLDEKGISRATVVGFIGILGRRLWQKQA